MDQREVSPGNQVSTTKINSKKIEQITQKPK